MKRKFVALVVTVCMLFTTFSAFTLHPVLADSVGFSDVTADTVSSGAWKALSWAVEMGIINGFKDNTFHPEEACTREQFVVMLWRMLGKPEVNEKAGFSDIEESRPTYKALQWAVAEGIIKGYEDGTFKPEEPLQRQHVCIMIFRTEGKPKTSDIDNPFSDISENAGAYKAVIWGYENKVIQGYTDGTFKPEDYCQRQQVAIFLYRYYGTGWVIHGSDCYYYRNHERVTDAQVEDVFLDADGLAYGDTEPMTILRAKLIAKSVTDPSMTYEEKIRAAFDHVIEEYESTNHPRIPHYREMDWIYVYADDMFGPRGGGNCFSFTAAFALLAKAVGAREVYACNSGGHGWVEIDGLVYDPEQYHDMVDDIYAWSYSQVPNYRAAISAYEDNPWMRVEIPEL